MCVCLGVLFCSPQTEDMLDRREFEETEGIGGRVGNRKCKAMKVGFFSLR